MPPAPPAASLHSKATAPGLARASLSHAPDLFSPRPDLSTVLACLRIALLLHEQHTCSIVCLRAELACDAACHNMLQDNE